MVFRKAVKEDFYKIRNLYWTLIDREQDDPSFPHWKKGIHPLIRKNCMCWQMTMKSQRVS